MDVLGGLLLAFPEKSIPLRTNPTKKISSPKTSPPRKCFSPKSPQSALISISRMSSYLLGFDLSEYPPLPPSHPPPFPCWGLGDYCWRLPVESFPSNVEQTPLRPGLYVHGLSGFVRVLWILDRSTVATIASLAWVGWGVSIEQFSDAFRLKQDCSWLALVLWRVLKTKFVKSRDFVFAIPANSANPRWLIPMERYQFCNVSTLGYIPLTSRVRGNICFPQSPNRTLVT